MSYNLTLERKMSASETALLVIDVQESFRHRPFYRDEMVPAFVDRLQALVDGAKAAGMRIVQVFHIMESGPFAESSGFVTTLAPLRIQPDVVFRKRQHSALVGTGLETWLTANGVRRLIVSGIRTEQCCETTTRHASDLGYAVDYVGEATLTFPMTDANGREWSASEIRARTELVLAGRFARIARVEEALSGPARKAAA
jgi:nicotinamidase-related amidase